MSEIGIISNPHAKINRNDPEHNTLIWYLLGNQGQFEVTQSVEDLSTVCQKFAEAKVRTIGIIGGDGTISLTLAALVRAYSTSGSCSPEDFPRIMILRGGTVNVLATNLGIFGKPKDILTDFLSFFHSSRPLYEMKLRTLLVNGQTGFLFATGGAVKFLESFYENKTSAWGAARFFTKIVADGLSGGRFGGQSKALIEPEKLNLTIECGTQQSTLDLLTPVVMASTLPKIPYGLEFFPNLGRTLGTGEVIYSDQPPEQVVKAVAKAILSTDRNNTPLGRQAFESLTIQADPGFKFTLDGEIISAADGKVTIKLGPVFRFCSPYGKVIETYE